MSEKSFDYAGRRNVDRGEVRQAGRGLARLGLARQAW
jgi:hypothetical protein